MRMLHYCSALPYLPITNLYKFLFSMKHIGAIHPSVNAINYISGFMINVNKKKSLEFFLINIFIIIIYCHLIKRYNYPCYIYSIYTDKYKINKLLMYEISVFIYKITYSFIFLYSPWLLSTSASFIQSHTLFIVCALIYYHSFHNRPAFRISMPGYAR